MRVQLCDSKSLFVMADNSACRSGAKIDIDVLVFVISGSRDFHEIVEFLIVNAYYRRRAWEARYDFLAFVLWLGLWSAIGQFVSRTKKFLLRLCRHIIVKNVSHSAIYNVGVFAFFSWLFRLDIGRYYRPAFSFFKTLLFFAVRFILFIF